MRRGGWSNIVLIVAAGAAPTAWVSAAAPGAWFANPSANLDVFCGRLLDGRSDIVQTHVALSIRAGRIAAQRSGVAPGDSASPALVGIPRIDLTNFTCLPGLIDLHVHLTEKPQDMADLTVYFRRTRAEQRKISADLARSTLLAGFTSVRNVGAYIRGVDLDLRDAIDRGEVLGPRMQVSGFYLTVPGGGGDLLVPSVPAPFTPNFVRSGIARGSEQFAQRAETVLDSGADVIKVIASGAVLAFGGVPGAREMNREEIAAVVAVARRRGVKVAAHAHGADSIVDAIAAGVDTIEHASLIDANAIALARAAGTILVMDIYNGDYTDSEGRRQGWAAEFLRKNLDTTELQRRGFTAAVAAGVRQGFGTDAGVFPHGDNARQFRFMVARGMPPAAAIRSATSVAAEAMGWETQVGALAPGLLGDLIAVSGDPLADISVLETVAVVVQGGKVLKAPVR
jgi:imidazolonepropionase-like amidohydrolase